MSDRTDIVADLRAAGMNSYADRVERLPDRDGYAAVVGRLEGELELAKTRYESLLVVEREARERERVLLDGLKRLRGMLELLP